MSTRKIITAWHRKTKGGWEYNHYSEGNPNEHGESPSGTPEQMKSWAGCEWKRVMMTIDENGVIQ